LTWETATLADLSESIAYGYTASADPDADGPRFLRITDIVPDRIDWDSVPRCPISAEDKKKYQRVPGDLVIARTGASSGANAMFASTEDAVFASFLVRFRLDRTRAEPRFVSFVLRSPLWWDYVASSLTGSAQPQLNAKVMGRFEFALPSLAEQRRIVYALGAIDDKIDFNTSFALALARYATLLFESEGRTWEASGTLGDIVAPHRDSAEASEQELPYIGLDNMKPGSLLLTEWLTGEAAPQGQSTLFARGDILFGKLRPYFKKVGVAPLDGRCSTEILVLRPKSEPYWATALGYATSDEFIQHCVALSTGTKMPRAEWKNASLFRIAVPSPDQALALNEYARRIYDLVLALGDETRELRGILDLLLPPVVTGALTIRSASSEVEQDAAGLR